MHGEEKMCFTLGSVTDNQSCSMSHEPERKEEMMW